MDDHEIIELYWQRDEEAIVQTGQKYGSFCQSIAMNILSVREDAEECVNDTYQKAWTTIPPERPIAFCTWLGRIVRNLSINRYHFNRAKKRCWGADQLLSELEECIPDKQTTEGTIETQELSRVISDWLDSIPRQDRTLFIRRYWNGEGLQKLAEESGISPDKIAGRMFRLRKRLKTYLSEKEVVL